MCRRHDALLIRPIGSGLLVTTSHWSCAVHTMACVASVTLLAPSPYSLQSMASSYGLRWIRCMLCSLHGCNHVLVVAPLLSLRSCRGVRAATLAYHLHSCLVFAGGLLGVVHHLLRAASNHNNMAPFTVHDLRWLLVSCSTTYSVAGFRLSRDSGFLPHHVLASWKLSAWVAQSLCASCIRRLFIPCCAVGLAMAPLLAQLHGATVFTAMALSPAVSALPLPGW